MYNSWLIKPVANTNSNRYKLTSIPCNAHHGHVKPVGNEKKDEIDKLSFLKLLFPSKGYHREYSSNQMKNVLIFEYHSVPKISYTYSEPIVTKVFNCNNVLQDFNIDDFTSNYPNCTCASFSFMYNPSRIMADNGQNERIHKYFL